MVLVVGDDIAPGFIEGFGSRWDYFFHTHKTGAVWQVCFLTGGPGDTLRQGFILLVNLAGNRHADLFFSGFVGDCIQRFFSCPFFDGRQLIDGCRIEFDGSYFQSLIPHIVIEVGVVESDKADRVFAGFIPYVDLSSFEEEDAFFVFTHQGFKLRVFGGKIFLFEGKCLFTYKFVEHFIQNVFGCRAFWQPHPGAGIVTDIVAKIDIAVFVSTDSDQGGRGYLRYLPAVGLEVITGSSDKLVVYIFILDITGFRFDAIDHC